MSPVKKFFLIFFVLYLVGAVAIITVFKGPQISPEYMKANKADHQRYIEIVKSDAYKLHIERELLHPAEGQLADNVAFVQEYESREEYQREQGRANTFNMIFDFYNALAVVIIMVHFGKAPLLKFLDERIEAIERRIQRSEKARKEAEEKLTLAKTKIEGLETEKKKIEEMTNTDIEDEKKQIAAMTQENLKAIELEKEQRKRREIRQAAMKLKAELVELAVNDTAGYLSNNLTDTDQALLLDQFINRLEHVE